ncbi:glutathione S-transferase 3-like [Musa acuminata AAA Group]|uniref:glutathione S-transferase 3-like n=1 Tax=Musa acuminata AAA Group TaxID=214697 RepID=UPI0031E1C110
MGVKVYGMPMSTNTVRVLAALNEKGVEFELVIVDLRTGAHKKPDFLALNPFGQIPVLEDGDVVLFESRAINRYIATKYAEAGPDLLLSSGTPAERAVVDLWLEVESQQFGPPIAALVYEALIKPMLGGATDVTVVEAQATKLEKVLDVYEARLAQSKYLAGAEFTLVDLNHIPYTNYLMKTPKASLVTSRPHLLAWWQDVSSRPAWQKTAAAIPF